MRKISGCLVNNKITHLTMLQSIISRLAQNSFLLKGWCLTVISGLFAIAVNTKCLSMVFLLIIFSSSIIFWILDGYFLWQERLFRVLYDEVRLIGEENIDFSMNTDNIVIRGEKQKKPCWIDAIFSKTLLIYYGGILAIIFFTFYIYFYVMSDKLRFFILF